MEQYYGSHFGNPFKLNIMEQHFLKVLNSYAHSRVHITLRKGLEQILTQYLE